MFWRVLSVVTLMGWPSTEKKFPNRPESPCRHFGYGVIEISEVIFVRIYLKFIFYDMPVVCIQLVDLSNPLSPFIGNMEEIPDALTCRNDSI
jgi:hypothetical protein